MTQTLVAAALGLTLLTTGCASAIKSAVGGDGKDPERVAQVKTVAIVALDQLSYVPPGLASKVGGSLAGGLAGGQTAANWKADETENARVLYDRFAETMSTKGWKLHSLKAVVNNPAYQKVYAEKKDSYPADHKNHLQKPESVKGLLRPTNPEYLLSAQEWAQLARDLKVDAVVAVRIAFMSEQNDPLGIGVGSTYLSPKLSFHMFDAQSGEKIWHDRGYEGENSEESLGSVSGLESQQKMAKISEDLAVKTLRAFLK